MTTSRALAVAALLAAPLAGLRVFLQPLRRRAEPLDIEVRVVAASDFEFAEDVFGCLVQYPTTNGDLVDLGPITELELHQDDSSLLMVDTSGKRVYEVDCPRESDSCQPPELFAAIPEFVQPLAAARAMDDLYVSSEHLLLALAGKAASSSTMTTSMSAGVQRRRSEKR